MKSFDYYLMEQRLSSATAPRLDEAAMPKPIKGGFTIRASARSDGVPVTVKKAEVYDNTFAIEKGKKGYLVFHVPSGALVVGTRLKKEAVDVVKAAYAIAPVDRWQFAGMRDAPSDLINKWRPAVMPVRWKAHEVNDANRQKAVSAVRRDAEGWAKAAIKDVVKSAKRNIQTKARNLRHGRGWPQGFEGEAMTSIYGFGDTSYARHGIEQKKAGNEDVLGHLSGTRKKGKMSVRDVMGRAKARYSYELTIYRAQWNDDIDGPAYGKTAEDDESRVVVTYSYKATRVG